MAEHLCSYLCLLDSIVKLHAMDDKLYNDLLLESDIYAINYFFSVNSLYIGV